MQLLSILRELQHGRRLTVAVALSDLGVYALSQRIGELKKLGWPIERTMVRVPGGATVAQYYLSGVIPKDQRRAEAYLSLT
jgi:hypothetical protein